GLPGHPREQLAAEALQLLAQRDDEVGADGALLALHGARGVPLAEREPRARADELAARLAAPGERALEPPDGGADEVDLLLAQVAEEDLVAQVIADGLALPDHERHEDDEEGAHEEEPERDHVPERLREHGGDEVPDGVQRDPEEVAADG